MDTIDPWEVRFSHDKISKTFRDGRTIEELVAALRLGIIDAEDVEPIRLVVRNGELYTLDNRRLDAFRRARAAITYRMATPEEADESDWKFTTTNEGMSVQVR